MNRAELNEHVMRSAGLTKANVDRFYQGFVDLAKKELQRKGEFSLPGLGTMVVRVRKAREGRNPQTGEKIRIPRSKVVRFRAYKDIKELLNPGLVSNDTEVEESNKELNDID